MKIPTISPNERRVLRKIQDAADEGEVFEMYTDDPLWDALECLEDQFSPPLIELCERGYCRLTERGRYVLENTWADGQPKGEAP